MTDTSAGGKASGQARVVSCPQCGGDSLYTASNRYRPFCSARCKGIDLGAWASEEFRLPEAQGRLQAGPQDD